MKLIKFKLNYIILTQMHVHKLRMCEILFLARKIPSE